MASWFKTRRQANVELKKREDAATFKGMQSVYKWPWSKRKKPFFVGSYLEWINK
jgi:hypothetical protein